MPIPEAQLPDELSLLAAVEAAYPDELSRASEALGRSLPAGCRRSKVFMKKITIISLSAIILAGCSGTSQPTANVNTNRAAAPNSNTAVVTSQKTDDSLVVSSQERQA